jgi:hypothetical protein
MDLKFTGIVETVYPIKRSGHNKEYPRLPIKIRWVGSYHKHFWLFSIHWTLIEQYPVKEWDMIDAYYRMNTGVYQDTGIPHWSNNIVMIVQVDDGFNPKDHF